jgi:DNA repair exonuclease SbcCD nuclease subunit
LVGTHPHIVFPGNLQGRSIREQGQKGAVLVTVADGTVVDLERLIVDRARWTEKVLEIGDLDSEAAIVRAAEDALLPLQAEAEDRLVALRFALAGATPLHRQLVAHREQLADEIQAAAHRVHGDIWLEKLDLRTQPPARQPAQPASPVAGLAALLDDLGGSEDLRRRAEQLIAEVKPRIPGTIPAEEQDLDGELDGLIAEARELLLSRAGGE